MIYNIVAEVRISTTTFASTSMMRRGEIFFFCAYFHNLIFTLKIFSSVGTQNEAVQTEPGRPYGGPPHQKNLKTGSGAHLPEFGEV